MRILLTNDDGYGAEGLAVLERLALTLGDDVTIVAPAQEQSGKSRSLTLTEPVRVRRMGDRRWAVAGTPTDAVMVALAEVMQDGPPDLILSGVNRGSNLAEDVSYSGTVAAAMEGALAGIRSIALSQRIDRAAPHHGFAAADAWGERVLRRLVAADWGPRTLLNVNFPPVAADAVAGVRVSSQALRDYGRLKLDRRVDPRGQPYYWFALAGLDGEAEPGTDLAAIAAGYVSVTPLGLNLTHAPSLSALEQALA